jgi:hypothetical protein
VSENTVEEKVGGWITKTSSLVYENPWISVSHHQVQTPTGTDGIYGVVHFKNTAIGVVPIDDEGNTWLVKQSRYTLNQYTWEIPEGGCPTSESPLPAAKRKLAQWQELMRLHLSNSVTDELCVVFVARDLSPGQQALEATEDIVVQKLPLLEAIAMVKRGEITDGISVAALLRIALDVNEFL